MRTERDATIIRVASDRTGAAALLSGRITPAQAATISIKRRVRIVSHYRNTCLWVQGLSPSSYRLFFGIMSTQWSKKHLYDPKSLPPMTAIV